MWRPYTVLSLSIQNNTLHFYSILYFSWFPFYVPLNCHGHFVVVKSQSLVQLFCDLIDYSLLGFFVHGISQARILEWVAISFSRGSSWPRDQTHMGMCAAHMLSHSAKWLCLVSQTCPTLWDPTDCSPPGSSVHGDSPGKNTGVGCHALLQGNILTQESNPSLLHCRRILHHLSYQGSLGCVQLFVTP